MIKDSSNSSLSINIATDDKVQEGGLYVQFATDYESFVIWSKDHGNTFERKF